MATFQAMKRTHEEDSRDHPAKRARTEPEFELYHEVPGILKKYRYTPGVAAGVIAMFSLVFGQLLSLMEEELNHHQYKANLVFHVELMKNNPSGLAKTTDAYFRSDVMTILSAHAIDVAVQKAFTEIQKRIEKWTREGSGWVVTRVLCLYVNIAKYQPLTGSSYMELPKYLKKKEAIINVRNQDNECLKWALLSARHPVKKNAQRVTKYKDHENELDFTGIEFPTPLNQIPNVEHQNNLSINVFGYSESAGIHPLYLTKDHTRDPINLLLITKVEDGKILSHFCWIKDFNRLCFDQNKHHGKTFFCTRCITPHCSERTLKEHQIYCRGVDAPPCHAVFPEKSEDGTNPTIKFKNSKNMMKAPYVIYADTESIIRPVDSPNTDSNTVQTSEHVPCSFAYVIVRSDGQVTSECLYRGEDAMDVFFQQLEQELENIREDLKHIRPLRMTEDDWVNHENATKCWICDGPFTDYNPGDKGGMWKVLDHDHLTGRYRGPAHSKCNQQLCIEPYRSPIPVIFHNLKNYDAHHLISAIGRTEEKTTTCTDNNGEPIMHKDRDGKDKPRTVTDGGISGIVQNMEKLISFSWGQYRFLDSLQFLNASLDKLVNSTPRDAFRLTSALPHHELLVRKGVYPYEHMDDFSRFDETCLPPQEAFYSSLSDEGISEEDYKHAHEVWDTFDCRNIGDYHDLYLKTDVLLLADVFENFRQTALSTYKLDPAHYYTLPGYSWDALLKLTNIELEQITEANMYLFIEKGLRGGISMVSHRHAIANNRYMQNFDPSQPDSFLQYLDSNNLYGWAMSQPMPTGGFEWVNYTDQILETPANADCGFILEVDLEYPASLHRQHNDYPLAPEKMKVTNTMMSPYQQKLIDELGVSISCEKLVPNLMRKTRYVVHYRNLQLYLSLGLRLSKVHKVLQFQQSPWMTPFIHKNTQLRTQAKNDFEKDLYKLMNNAVSHSWISLFSLFQISANFVNCPARLLLDRSLFSFQVFGKTLENVRKRVNVKLLRSDEEQKILKLVAKPTFAQQVIFNEHLVGIQNHKEKVLLNKPIYVGMSVLDLSKHLMYDFYYNTLKARYGDKIRLLYTDTDSLIVHVQTEDIYADMAQNLDDYDTSNYPADHPLFSTANKKIIGKFKDELGGKVMTEFIGIRPKMYSYVGEESGKRAKGVKKSVLCKTISHDDYRTCLLEKKVYARDMPGLRSRAHTIYGETVHKVALAPLDTKRYILDGISTLAFGHVDIPTSTVT